MRVSMVVLAMLFSSVARGEAILLLTTTGAGNITISQGYEWTSVTIQCWGGGGGGACGSSYNTTGWGGGGGGAGAYSHKTYMTPLVAGMYDYYIGAGGNGGAYSGNGTDGGNTIWNYGTAQDIVASGGGGGGYAYGGDGGGGGTIVVGTGCSGGNGGDGSSGYGSGGGGGGSGWAGGDGGTLVAQGVGTGGSGGVGYGPGGSGGSVAGRIPASSGALPGGGGGGGFSDYFSLYQGRSYNSGTDGGRGANGEIVITYTQQATPEPPTFVLLVIAIIAIIAPPACGKYIRARGKSDPIVQTRVFLGHSYPLSL